MSHVFEKTRTDRRLRAAGFRPDDRGVSEIVGSLLLIGITVLLVGGFATLILSVKPPNDTLHADLSMNAVRGPDGLWGTGDEEVRIQHAGGEPIPRDGLSIQVDVAGTVSSYGGSGLDGSAFDDGELTIGETWSATLTIPNEADVHVDMILDAGRSSTLITSSRIRVGAGCEPDTTAPTVIEWTQTPADVTTTTSGAVTVTAELGDECAGVDGSVDPHLEFRINDGSDPAWTDQGAMNDAGTGTGTWTLDIPDQTWTSQLGQSLQYRLTGMTDLDGNSGTSTMQSDTIQLSGGTDTYTDGHTDNAGSVSDFSNARDDADGGAFATLTEDASDPPTTYYATAASGTGTGTATDATGAPDDARYVIDDNGEQITVRTIDTSGASGTITKVEMVFEGHYQNLRIDDTVDLQVDAGSGMTTVLDDHVPNSGTDTRRTVDITGQRGSWTFTDVQDLRLRAAYDKTGPTDPMAVHVDAMWTIVTVASASDMDIELTFPALPVATNHVLELEYAVTDDTFHVEVWDGTTWNQRGVTMDQAGFTVWVYSLTATETTADGGSPLIRIVDDSDASPAGTVRLDYVKVVSG